MSVTSPTLSASFAGRAEPRIFTPPLRELTPETSKGFACIDFAEKVLGVDLLPWQKWLLIHALELAEDGTYRFKTVVVLVARQNGKTFLLKVLALFRLFVDGAQLVLGTAQTLQIAKEAWSASCDMALTNPWLRVETQKKMVGVGLEALILKNGARYKVAAANDKAGRGLSVDLLILDELAQHRSPDAWAALSATTRARRLGMNFAISTPGDANSVILNQLQDAGRSGGTTSLGLFEWSAPDGCDLEDREAWAQANPGLGYTIDERSIQAALETDPPAIFRTEVLCQRILTSDAAISMDAWRTNRDVHASLNNAKSRLVLCFDVSNSNEHATLVAAAKMGGNRIVLGTVAEWRGPHCRDEARRDLPGILDKLKPTAFGWFPSGPAAALVADLRSIRRGYEIKATEVNAACMGFSEQVSAGRIIHNGDRMLHTHAESAEKMRSGDGWRFARPREFNAQDIDGIYAAAGAVHLLRTQPDLGIPRIVSV